MAITIRAEHAEDVTAIRAVHAAAFVGHPFSRQTEARIVEALRADGALAVSLVAEEDGSVVGHIAFSPVTIDGGFRQWYGVGPVGVLPSFQRQGIGSALLRAGLERVRSMGGEGCVLVGEPEFYERFGFRQRAELTLEGFPPEVFLSLPLTGEMPRGQVVYAAAFGLEG